MGQTCSAPPAKRGSEKRISAQSNARAARGPADAWRAGIRGLAEVAWATRNPRGRPRPGPKAQSLPFRVRGLEPEMTLPRFQSTASSQADAGAPGGAAPKLHVVTFGCQ